MLIEFVSPSPKAGTQEDLPRQAAKTLIHAGFAIAVEKDATPTALVDSAQKKLVEIIHDLVNERNGLSWAEADLALGYPHKANGKSLWRFHKEHCDCSIREGRGKHHS